MLSTVAIAFLVAFVSAAFLHPKVVEIARDKGITDNPNPRKLQQTPVPVLGGTVVFFGILVSMGGLSFYYGYSNLAIMAIMMVVMLYVGTIDDISGLTYRFKFKTEILLSLVFVWLSGQYICDFQGLWGIHSIPSWCGILLTVLTMVGIINALNLIDGVNGLCSGYCILACGTFGIYFYQSGEPEMVIMMASCIGALFPFFFHNVFGKRLRMFIGDGGSLMMGMILAICVIRILSGSWRSGEMPGGDSCVIPFVLAVMSMPVFDTLRVMTMRMVRRTSPFHPDKTHLHHAFIGAGFTHFKTTLSILLLNVGVVGIWYLLYRIDCSLTIQLYGVILSGLLCVIVPYLILKEYRKEMPKK